MTVASTASVGPFKGLTNEEVIALLPKDTMSFAEIVEEIKKMEKGESRKFNFDPRDIHFHKPQSLITVLLGFQSKTSSLDTTFEVDPQRAKFSIKVTIHLK